MHFETLEVSVAILLKSFRCIASAADCVGRDVALRECAERKFYY